MTGKNAYTYTVLRYVHDIVTGEFVNVGVVLFAPSARAVRYKTRVTIGRLKGAFPDIDRAAFVSAMHSARRALQKIAKAEIEAGFLSLDGNAGMIARRAIPEDDSSLQWSPIGAGLTNDIDATTSRLFERLVSRYDTHNKNRRSDEDVWRPVRQKLEELDLAECLQPKSITGAVDNIVFKHAWKNGQWHVYEPLSFDLVDADGIKAKAREWLGHLSAVVSGGSTEHFKPHFIVGAPSNPSLEPAFQNAITILRMAPNAPEVFQEAEVGRLVEQIEDEVRSHRAA